ncbi:MAG: glycosyltransferase family 4 protein [Chthoniobacterales bacterium]
MPVLNTTLAYLFERYPAFTQTFCVREVEGLRRAGLGFPIYSIRYEDGFELQKLSSDAINDLTHLPRVERLAKKWMRPFAHRARAARHRLVKDWGRSGDRNRAYEAVWLGPELKSRGVSHVHVHFSGIAARTAFWLKKFYGITYSITAHANDFFVTGEEDRLTCIFKEAKFVITVSDYSVDQLLQLYPCLEGKLHRVYNGIDTACFSSESANPQPEPHILSVGRLIEKKGYHTLIEACAELSDISFKCSIIGDGPLYESLQSRIVELGLQEKVFLLGPKTESEVKELLLQTSVFALACCTESDGGRDNLPTVIMEAMAASLPVVSTKIAGVPEMVIEGETGLLSEEKNPVAFAANLRCLMEDEKRASAMGETGRKLAEERFDTNKTTAEVLAVFKKYGLISERVKAA